MTRIAAATALVALAMAGAGCATSGSGIQAGERVTVYVSMPLRGPAAAEGRDVVRASRLALAEAKGRAGKLAVRAVYLDDTEGRGARARWSQAVAAANARDAAEDSSAIAYVGDFDSGATRASLPITNEARMLQVSPTSSAVDLVQPFLGAGDQLPEEVQATGERTFGRVIPSDEVQAEAGAVWAKRLVKRGLPRSVTGVQVASDGSEFGDVMRSAFTDQARSIRIQPRRVPGVRVGPPPDTYSCVTQLPRQVLVIYYAGARQPSVRPVDPCGRTVLMLPDPFLAPTALLGLGSIEGRILVTSAAQDPSQLPPAGQRFVKAFAQRYGRQPGRYAAYGYEAMAVVLDSIRRAGDQGDDRDAVVDAFFETQDRDSVLGTYSIDEVGDTTLGRLAGYRLVAGHPVFKTALRVP